MALGSDVKRGQQQTTQEIEEVLEGLEKLIERTKVMYEQYFMGIQKMAPAQLHRDVERKVRELTQHQIRNTGLRFRFQTLSQKFGAYNTYWKRTLREIEQGRYVRDLARVKRKADEMGEDLPEELLAKLPKLVQDRIRRERGRMAEKKRTEAAATAAATPDEAAAAATMHEVSRAPRPAVHRIDEEEAAGSLFGDGDLDMDNLFGALTGEAPAPAAKPIAKPTPRPDLIPSASPSPAPGPIPKSAPVVTKPMDLIPRSAPKVGVPVPRQAGAVPPPSVPTTRVPVVPPPIPGAAAKPPPSPAPAAAPPPGMSEKQCRELHASYVKARQMVGEKDPVPYDKMMATLGKQAPAIMKEHGAKGVEYQVVVRGEKVILKAKPIK
ncbi:MAG TPA: MXAN_5187 C-terminal domain-containing protein [Kofleriaceae bacterium]|nr:MXAN_5187 C-terminal domain-containing protein [Kofleriaceae bacterium]